MDNTIINADNITPQESVILDKNDRTVLCKTKSIHAASNYKIHKDTKQNKKNEQNEDKHFVTLVREKKTEGIPS